MFDWHSIKANENGAGKNMLNHTWVYIIFNGIVIDWFAIVALFLIHINFFFFFFIENRFCICITLMLCSWEWWTIRWLFGICICDDDILIRLQYQMTIWPLCSLFVLYNALSIRPHHNDKDNNLQCAVTQTLTIHFYLLMLVGRIVSTSSTIRIVWVWLCTTQKILLSTRSLDRMVIVMNTNNTTTTCNSS